MIIIKVMLLPQLKHLVNESTVETSRGVLSELPSSCAPEDVTALHHYCYRMKVGGSDQLKQIMDKLSFLEGYYSGQVNIILNKETALKWLETSSIPANQNKNILQPHS